MHLKKLRIGEKPCSVSVYSFYQSACILENSIIEIRHYTLDRETERQRDIETERQRDSANDVVRE